VCSSDLYKEECEKAETDGRRPHKKQPKLSQITAEEMKEMPVLPDTWGWTKNGNLCYFITDGTHLKPNYVSQGYSFLSVKNVRPGLIRDDDIKYISLGACRI
jgi:hypothetical protein